MPRKVILDKAQAFLEEHGYSNNDAETTSDPTSNITNTQIDTESEKDVESIVSLSEHERQHNTLANLSPKKLRRLREFVIKVNQDTKNESHH